MIFSILTLFPEMFSGPLSYSILKRAQDQKIITVNLVNIRDFAMDKYKTVDDHPYGGGEGMILKVDVIDRALQVVKQKYNRRNLPTYSILLEPRGAVFNQAKARQLSNYQHLILICGHYEGVDARVGKLVNETISIGQFIVTGGELPAMIIIDSVSRLIPGVLAKPTAVHNESFTDNLIEAPQYTRPVEYKNMRVPEVLLSGHHQQIKDWRKNTAIKITSMKLRGK